MFTRFEKYGAKGNRDRAFHVGLGGFVFDYLLCGRCLGSRRHELLKAAQFLARQADRDGGNAAPDRVHLFTRQEDFVIEVRSGRETGFSEIANDLALGDTRTGADPFGELSQMAVRRLKLVGMLDLVKKTIIPVPTRKYH